MKTDSCASAPASRRQLATCIAAVLGLSEATAMSANTWTVTSCLDDSTTAGTLRNVIGLPSTLSGDTIEFTGLNCPNSTITLAAGYGGITIGQNALNIYGPGADALTIDGSGLDPTTYSALYHTGSSNLTISGLTITGGHLNRQGSALGGCIYSRGNVRLGGTTVASCSATSDGVARGGGVYAKGKVLVALGSIVTGNTASGSAGTSGGGVFAGTTLEMYFATLSGNSATATGGPARGGGGYAFSFVSLYSTISGNHVSAPITAFGGGFNAKDGASLQGSTISGNTSSASAGGAYVTHTFSMYNSTVSGNSAATKAGALYLNGDSSFFNSTIAFNAAVTGTPGVLLHAAVNPMQIDLQSTLISNNSYGASDNDLSVVNPNLITFNSGPAHNLIRVTGVTGLPADTKFDTCPLVGPLRDNGGLTLTHQLLSGSVAIDAGNNVAIDPLTHSLFVDDQRGAGVFNGSIDYLRVSGSQADIGAYEVQQGDIVFNGGFDGCHAP